MIEKVKIDNKETFKYVNTAKTDFFKFDSH